MNLNGNVNNQRDLLYRYIHKYLQIQGLDKIIGTLPFLVLYLKRPTTAAPIVGSLVFFEF